MIKVTLVTGGQNTPQTFEKESITVGPEGANDIDFVIENANNGPAEPWLAISKYGDNFKVTNLAGSEEIKLNGATFTESEVPSGAFLSLFGTEIKVENNLSQALFLDIDGTDENFEFDENFDLDKELEKLGDFFKPGEPVAKEEMEFSEKEFEDFIASAEKIVIKEEDKPVAEEEKIDLETVKLEFSEAELDPELTADLFEEENPETAEINIVEEPPAQVKVGRFQSASSFFSTEPKPQEEDSYDAEAQTVEEEAREEKLKSGPLKSKIGKLSSSSEFFFDPSEGTFGKEAGVSVETQWADIQETAGGKAPEAVELKDTVNFDPFNEKIRPKSSALSTAVLVLMAFIVCLGFGGIGAIYYLQNQNTVSQMTAAIATADCAMALLHAKVNHLDIYHENVLDGDFLGDALNNLLPAPYREQSPIDHGGKLDQIGYRFKIFTTDNFSRFILLAIPSDSYSQWLVPNKTIVLDSNDMELKKTKKMGEWVSFLSSSTDLNMLNQTRLDKMLSSEESIPLFVLHQSYPALGFSLPRDLTYRNPLGKNLIYNAPRYRKITSNLVNELIGTSDKDLDNGQAIKLTDSLRVLSELRHFVFYTEADSEQSRKGLINLQKQLKKPILLGHVQLDQNGYVNKIEVLESDQFSDFTYQAQWGKKSGQMSEESEEGADVATRIDISHPLHITIVELANQRQQALKEVKDKILALLEEHTKKENPNFFNEYKALLDRFEAVSQEHKKKIEKVLDNLYNDYVAKESKEQKELFMTTVKMAELEDFLPEYLKTKEQKQEEKAQLNNPGGNKEPTAKDIQASIDGVGEAKNFTELHDKVAETAGKLAEYRPASGDEEAEIKEKFRRAVLGKVGELVLSPEYAHTPQLFQDQNRTLLSETLNIADITESEERNFYLNEFDILMAKFRNVVNTDLRMMQRQKQYIDSQLEEKDDLIPFEVVELEEKKKDLNKDISDKRAEMGEIKNQMTRIPISTRVHTQEEYKGNVGRLGQQIIIQVSLESPSNERDEKLKEAINLLSQGTEDDRSLWGDILEARRLITQNPEMKIREVLESDIGFSHKVKNPLPTQVRNLLKDYVESYQELVVTKDPRKYEALFETFSQRQRKNLQDVIGISNEIVDKSRKLATNLDEYIAKLEEFSEDYKKAKEQGFFVTSRAYHQAMATRLNQKLASAQHLRGSVRGVVQHLIQSSEEHRELAEEELAKLDTAGEMDPDAGYVLLKRNQNMRFPNLIAENLDSRVDKIFSMEVYPLPQ